MQAGGRLVTRIGEQNVHRDIATADGEFDIFQRITAADVQRVARTYVTAENRTVLTIMPSGATVAGAGR